MRTTCSDEMLATPLTAWPAMRVKSGPPPAGGRGGAGGGAWRPRARLTRRSARRRGGALGARLARRDRIRPVSTRPATKPAHDERRRATERRRIMQWHRQVTSMRRAPRSAAFGMRDGEDAVLEIGA